MDSPKQQIDAIELTTLKARIDSAIDSLKSVSDDLEDLERRVSFELVGLEKASEILSLSERQVQKLAKQPGKTGIHRYNTDGSLKTSSKRTPVRYNKVELLRYKSNKTKGKNNEKSK